MRIAEDVISRPLADLGYMRVERYVYRALWSSEEVEHFLYFSAWGTSKDYLTAYFGLRNPRAELFGVRSILAYGGDLYRQMQHDARTDCCMRFSLGMLAGWGSRSSIYLPETSGPQISATITASVRGRLFPLVGQTTTIDQLLSLLLSDAEPFIWARTNGAIRAAKIVDLARQRSMPSEDIRVALQPHKRQIGGSLSKAPDPNPDSYIDRILQDST